MGCIHSYSGTHRQTLTHMQLAHNGALDMSSNNINSATHTVLRARGKEKEPSDVDKKKTNLKE